MTNSYINKIKANTTIFATKKATNVLEGTYTSVFTGRSMNFEDLRDYVPSDSMRDIEWKASTRSGKLLVKRFVAEKKHNILLVVDTGERMLGETGEGEIKKELSLFSVGTIAYLAYKNGDEIGVTYSNKNKICYEPFRTGLSNVERILTLCDKAIIESEDKNAKIHLFQGRKKEKEESVITRLLNETVFRLKKRMIIFIVTDLKGAAGINENVLKRIKCIHDVLLIITDDAKVTGGKKASFDIEEKQYLPAYITENKKLIRLEDKKIEELKNDVYEKCKKLGISWVTVNNTAEISEKMIELLEKHRHESKIRKR